MRVERFRNVIETTGLRIAREIAPPKTSSGAETDAQEAVTLLKAAVEATAPGQFEAPERQILRTLQLQEGGRRASRSELERTLGRDDLVDLNYLLRGLEAARPVGRIGIRDAGGRPMGDATGFMITPALLLTNHHVLPDAATASASWVEFNCELDTLGFARPTTTFGLDPDRFFIVDEGLDFALIAVRPTALRGPGTLVDQGWLRLSAELGKINVGEPITIIQHPNGRAKQVALRENRLLDISADHLTYESDTAPGSSGAPVFNDSWQVVGLHHSGVPRKDAQGRWLRPDGQPASDEDDDSDIDWIANEGVRASRIATTALAAAPAGPLRDQLAACCEGRASPPLSGEMRNAVPAAGRATTESKAAGTVASAAAVSHNTAALSVPLTLTVSLAIDKSKALAAGDGTQADASGAPVSGASALERVVEPWHDPDYGRREGYVSDFLGIEVPLPTVVDPSVVAAMIDGRTVVPYQNFSLVMHRARRLCLFTASNVDGSAAAKAPDPTRKYSRDALGGLGENDFEKWFLDPRLPAEVQLPDRFFNKDRKAFDKGHMVRREEVCWGLDYDQVRRANGDTYHVTNCTPQVGHFNRSNLKGVWGLLENMIQQQAASERLTLFAGPVLAEDDPVFFGVDNDGAIQVRVPRAYWKVVAALGPDGLETFGFLLEQDLTKVEFEFAVAPVWRERLIPIAALQTRIGLIRFAPEVLGADRGVAGADVGGDGS